MSTSLACKLLICLNTLKYNQYEPAVNTASTGLPVVVLSYVIDLVRTFHSGEAKATRTVNSNGQSSVKAKQIPATVTAASTGQTQPAALASSKVVTGKAASMLFLESQELNNEYVNRYV